MTNKELQEYLTKFNDGADVVVIIAWPERRKVYQHNEVILLTDIEVPVIILQISGERDMTDEEISSCEECENAAYQEYRKQHPLPAMKNNDQRKQFLNGFHEWPVWFAVPEADETYYRYDLPDGSGIVVCEYKTYLEHLKKYGRNPEVTYTREYLLKPGYHHLNDCKTSTTGLINHLKEIQKGQA